MSEEVDEGSGRVGFQVIAVECLCDVKRSFPELQLSADLEVLLREDGLEDDDERVVRVRTFCGEKMLPHFLDILYKNEKLFDKECEFLPGINFSELWANNLSDSTRDIIWGYLQLLAFASVDNISDTAGFGETARLFEAISPDHLEEKLTKTVNELFKTLGTSDSTQGLRDAIPDPSKLNSHLQKMLGGKIGRLAQEIAQETVLDMDDDLRECSSVEELMKGMLKDPGRLLKIVKRVGTALDQKVKKGEVSEAELVQEAEEMMNNLKDIPGLDSITQMMERLGGSKRGSGYNHIRDKLAKARQKAKMRQNLERRNEKSGSSSDVTDEDFAEVCKRADEAVKELLAASSSQGVADNKSNRRKKKKKKKRQ